MEGATTTRARATTAATTLFLLSLFYSAATAATTTRRPSRYKLYVRNEGSIEGDHTVSFTCRLTTSTAGEEWSHQFYLMPREQQQIIPLYPGGVDVLFVRMEVARMGIRALGPNETATVDCTFDAGDGCTDSFPLFDSRLDFYRHCGRLGCLYTVQDTYLKVRPMCPVTLEDYRFTQAAYRNDDLWSSNYHNLPYAVSTPATPSHAAGTRCVRKRLQHYKKTWYSFSKRCRPSFKKNVPIEEPIIYK